MVSNNQTPKFDGCSGGMSWFWRTFFKKPPSWEKCCDVHDTEYQKGGCKLRRLWSDLKLRACVAQKSVRWAKIMYRAVRFGGHPISPFFNSRWGFSRHYTMLYPPPTKAERLWLTAEIKKLKKEWQELLKKEEGKP